jgi:DNA repair photolyase
MNSPHSQYISASRRTDIPRFFHTEFFEAWQAGEIRYNGGYGRSYTVSLRRENVLGFVFWSKDFSRFIEHPEFVNLIASNNAVFHFTINDCPNLEPHVAPLSERLTTLGRLCDLVGPQRVMWRFDPICKYRHQGRLVTNFESFFRILPHVKANGVTRCYFSFMTKYAKLGQRKAEFGDFDGNEKSAIACRLLEAAENAGLMLYNCCNPEVVKNLAPRIRQAHCIDEEVLRETDRFGVHRSLLKKATRKGCGCYEARDIGAYSQKCGHGCSYCYANPG